MNLATAQEKMATRELQPGEHWMYLSKDGGKHGILTNEEQPADLGYSTKDVLYVWEGR